MSDRIAGAIVDALCREYAGEDWRTKYPDTPDVLYVEVTDLPEGNEALPVATFAEQVAACVQEPEPPSGVDQLADILDAMADRCRPVDAQRLRAAAAMLTLQGEVLAQWSEERATAHERLPAYAATLRRALDEISGLANGALEECPS